MTITIPAPDGIEAAGRGAVLFVPAVADLTAPTMAEMSAGIALQCALDAFPTSLDQPTTTRTKYCMKQGVQSPGKATYSVGPLVVDWDHQSLDSTGKYAYQEDLVEGAKGYLIDRRGLDHDAAWAAGQIVTIWPVTIGAPIDVDIDAGSTDGQTLRRQFNAFVRDQVQFDVAIAAGA